MSVGPRAEKFNIVSNARTSAGKVGPKKIKIVSLS